MNITENEFENYLKLLIGLQTQTLKSNIMELTFSFY